MTKHMFGRYGIIDSKTAFIYKKNEEELRKAILKWRIRTKAIGLEGLMKLEGLVKRCKLMKNISKATRVLDKRKSFSSLFKFFNTASESERSNIRLKHVERVGNFMLKKRLEERERKNGMQVSILL